MIQIDNDQALELIEEAAREAPFCLCGEPTVPVGRRAGVWLECASLLERKGALRRLLSLDLAFAHTRRPIVDLPRSATTA